MSRNRKRTKLFVDSKVQGVLVRQLVCHWVVASFVVFVFLLIMQILSSPVKLPVSTHVADLFSKYGVLLVAVVAMFPVFMYDSIKLSNRIAGPMVSFRNSLTDLANGKAISKLHFRERDFWGDLGEQLNQVADRMNLVTESSDSASS